MDNIKALIDNATEKALNNRAENHKDKQTKNQTGKDAQSLKYVMLKNVTQSTHQLMGQLKIAISASIVSLFALFWFYVLGELEMAGVLVLSAWSVGTAFYAFYLARKKHSAESSLMNIRADLFEHCCNDIRFKIKIIKLLGPILLMESTALMGFVLIKKTPVAAGLPIFIALSALFAGFVIYQYAAVLPRLTQELKILNGEV